MILSLFHFSKYKRNYLLQPSFVHKQICTGKNFYKLDIWFLNYVKTIFLTWNYTQKQNIISESMEPDTTSKTFWDYDRKYVPKICTEILIFDTTYNRGLGIYSIFYLLQSLVSRKWLNFVSLYLPFLKETVLFYTVVKVAKWMILLL